MELKWFKDITTLEELEAAHKELSKRYHPDKVRVGGEFVAMTEINTEYNKIKDAFEIMQQFKPNEAPPTIEPRWEARAPTVPSAEKIMGGIQKVGAMVKMANSVITEARPLIEFGIGQINSIREAKQAKITNETPQFVDE